jgi:hypothetical protein
MDELLSTLADSGYELPETALITRVIDARVIMAPGQDISDKRVSDLKMHNHDILRATYMAKGEDGTLERKQLEFIVDMGGEK